MRTFFRILLPILLTIFALPAWAEVQDKKIEY